MPGSSFAVFVANLKHCAPSGKYCVVNRMVRNWIWTHLYALKPICWLKAALQIDSILLRMNKAGIWQLQC